MLQSQTQSTWWTCSKVKRARRFIMVGARRWIQILVIGIYVTCVFFLGMTYNVHRGNDVDRRTVGRQLLDIPLNVSELEVARRILQGPVGDTDKLIRVVKALEQNLYPPIISPKHSVGFDPDEGDVVLPGGIYHDLDVKYEWERRKVPDPVQLSAHARDSIQRIITQLGPIHKQRANKHHEPPLNLYPKERGKK